MECTWNDQTDFRGGNATKVQDGKEGAPMRRVSIEVLDLNHFFREIVLDHLVSPLAFNIVQANVLLGRGMLKHLRVQLECTRLRVVML